MRKLFFFVFAALFTLQITAQPSEAKYRRSSLYAIKVNVVDDNPEHAEAISLMNAAYEAMPMPEAYNDFNLSTRFVDFDNLPDVTEEEMAVYRKKGAGGMLGKMAKEMAQEVVSDVPGVKVSNITPEEYIARFNKYLAEKKVANMLVAKWHNDLEVSEASLAWDMELRTIAKYGLVGLSEEEKSEILENGGSLVATARDCEDDLIPNTYVIINRYSFLTGQELFEELSAPIVAQLQSANPLVAVGLNKALEAMKKKYATGYFVRCHAYLFQIEGYNSEDFWTKYATEDDFSQNAHYNLRYLGKSEGRARARKADDGNVIALAVQRATDKCYADLQHDFEQFRPFAALHEIDGQLGAYIGTKEGITEKSEFNVYELHNVKDKKSGNIKQEYKVVGKLKVEKGGVWNNAVGEDENDEEAEKPIDDARTFTLFKGKPGKLGEGHLIRLAK